MYEVLLKYAVMHRILHTMKLFFGRFSFSCPCYTALYSCGSCEDNNIWAEMWLCEMTYKLDSIRVWFVYYLLLCRLLGSFPPQCLHLCEMARYPLGWHCHPDCSLSPWLPSVLGPGSLACIWVWVWKAQLRRLGPAPARGYRMCMLGVLSTGQGWRSQSEMQQTPSFCTSQKIPCTRASHQKPNQSHHPTDRSVCATTAHSSQREQNFQLGFFSRRDKLLGNIAQWVCCAACCWLGRHICGHVSDDSSVVERS